jgi:hypothetical protein
MRKIVLMRKIVQIVATATEGVDTVFALCDDGTVWAHCPQGDSDGWRRMPRIPQPPGESDPGEAE